MKCSLLAMTTAWLMAPHANYGQMEIVQSQFGSGGGLATSSSHQLIGSLGESIVESSSAVYHALSAGFLDDSKSLAPDKIEMIRQIVDGIPTTVRLSNRYISPVVVCSLEVEHNTDSVIIRIENALSDRFDIWLQNPSARPVTTETAGCLVMEQGAWLYHDQWMEARKYESTVTDTATSWFGERQYYQGAYNKPVVLGQVMTANDPLWSSFWSCGIDRTSPPSSDVLVTGKHVGEDTDSWRESETVGYIVFEAGHDMLFANEYEAGVTHPADAVSSIGVPASTLFKEEFTNKPQVFLSSPSTMIDSDGGWSQFNRSTVASPTSIDLAFEEDQCNDTERSHAIEQVAFIAFEGKSHDELCVPTRFSCRDAQACIDDEVVECRNEHAACDRDFHELEQDPACIACTVPIPLPRWLHWGHLAHCVEHCLLGSLEAAFTCHQNAEALLELDVDFCNSQHCSSQARYDIVVNAANLRPSEKADFVISCPEERGRNIVLSVTGVSPSTTIPRYCLAGQPWAVQLDSFRDIVTPMDLGGCDENSMSGETQPTTRSVTANFNCQSSVCRCVQNPAQCVPTAHPVYVNLEHMDENASFRFRMTITDECGQVVESPDIRVDWDNPARQVLSLDFGAPPGSQITLTNPVPGTDPITHEEFICQFLGAESITVSNALFDDSDIDLPAIRCCAPASTAPECSGDRGTDLDLEMKGNAFGDTGANLTYTLKHTPPGGNQETLSGTLKKSDTHNLATVPPGTQYIFAATVSSGNWTCNPESLPSVVANIPSHNAPSAVSLGSITCTSNAASFSVDLNGSGFEDMRGKATVVASVGWSRDDGSSGFNEIDVSEIGNHLIDNVPIGAEYALSITASYSFGTCLVDGQTTPILDETGDANTGGRRVRVWCRTDDCIHAPISEWQTQAVALGSEDPDEPCAARTRPQCQVRGGCAVDLSFTCEWTQTTFGQSTLSITSYDSNGFGTELLVVFGGYTDCGEIDCSADVAGLDCNIDMVCDDGTAEQLYSNAFPELTAKAFGDTPQDLLTGDAVVSSNRVFIQGDAWDEEGIRGFGIFRGERLGAIKDSVLVKEIELNGANSATLDTSLDVGGWASGEYTLWVLTRDADGFYQSWSAAGLNVRIDSDCRGETDLPIVALDWSPPGSAYAVGDIVTVEVVAPLPTEINHVEFFVDDVLVTAQPILAPPFQYSYVVQPGAHVITAVVQDPCGNAAGAQVNINEAAACPPPADGLVVTLDSPADPTVAVPDDVDNPTPFVVSVTVGDPADLRTVKLRRRPWGTTEVAANFHIFDPQLDGVNTAPGVWTYTWNATIPAGNWEVIARAVHDCGNAGADWINVMTDPCAVSDIEMVSVVAPAQDTTFFHGETMSIQIAAADPAGIRQLSILAQRPGDLQFSDLPGSPCVFDPPVTTGAAACTTTMVAPADRDGTWTIRALAEDACENSDSSEITIAVEGPCASDLVDSASIAASHLSPAGGQIVTITGSASDSDSGISEIRVLAENPVTGVWSPLANCPFATPLPSPSCTYDWTAHSPGETFRWKTQADNSCGQTKESALMPVTTFDPCSVVNGPTVSISSPGTGSSHDIGTIVQIAANASDSDGIENVSLLVNGIWKSSDITAPYALPYTVELGVNTITMRAFDKCGHSFDASISITGIDPCAIDNGPTVSISTPFSGSTYIIGTPVTIKATASDPDGIEKVNLLVNAIWESSDFTTPFEIPYTVQAGTKTITMRAFDNCGNTSDAEISIAGTDPCQGDNSVDSMWISADNLNPLAEDVVTFTASASDIKGIKEIRILAQNTANGAWSILQTCTFGPPLPATETCIYQWTAHSPGSTFPWAVEADDGCNQSENLQTSITVVDPCAGDVVDAAGISANDTAPDVGQAVTITGSASDTVGITEIRLKMQNPFDGSWTVMETCAYTSPLAAPSCIRSWTPNSPQVFNWMIEADNHCGNAKTDTVAVTAVNP